MSFLTRPSPPRSACAPCRASQQPPTTTATDYGWNVDRPPVPLTPPGAPGPRVIDVPPAAIRRPLGRARTNDGAKLAALKASFAAVGQLDPIDVLECDGALYGFSGCHRYQAATELGLATIRCRVRRVTAATLRMHVA